jgi:hypothetical protein
MRWFRATSFRGRPHAAAAALLLTAAAGGLAAQQGSIPSATGAKLAELTRLIHASAGADLVDLDADMARAGLQVRAMVPELGATSEGPAGPVTHIPVQINPTAQGRTSILRLGVGQSTVAGVYVAAGGVYERVVKRLTGSGALAAGDLLEEHIARFSGEDVQTLRYRVKAVDHTAGTFRAANLETNPVRDGDVVNGQHGWCWFCNGGSSWWCGFPCFPDDLGPADDEPTTAVIR